MSERDPLVVWMHRVLGFLLAGTYVFFRAMFWNAMDAWRLFLITVAAGLATGWVAGRYGQGFWNWLFGRRV